jgi:tetratricopeptide (TPR) repeat protein
LTRSLELARRMGDRVGTSVTLNNLGNTWGDMGDYRKALEYYTQAYQIDLEAGDNYSASLDAGNMGWVYLEMEDRARALECWEKQMAWSEKFGDRHSVSIALGNMAAVHILQGDYQTGRWEVEARLKIAREMGDKKGQSLAYSYLASIHRACGDWELAGEALNRAIGLAREIGLRNYLAVFLLEQADILFAAGRPTEAEVICQESLEISEASGKADTAFKCRLLLARLLGGRQPREGARQLEALREQAWQQSQRAVISHELYRLTGEERHREEAREIYAQLYEQMPDDDYRKKLEELSQ